MLSAFKNFLITLLIAAFVFGLIGYFTTKYLSDIITDILDGNSSETPVINAPDETDDENDKIPDDLKIPDGESFTMLFVGTDYRPDLYTNYYTTLEEFQKIVDEAKDKATEETKKSDATDKKSDSEKADSTEKAESKTEADTTTSKSRAKDEPREIKEPDSVLKTDVRYIRATWIVLVRADKENREYVSCYISPETAVNAPCGESDLGEVYGLYGLDTLTEFVSAMTGLEIDYRFVLDAEHQRKIADVLGGVEFELDSDIYSSKEEYLSVQPVDSDTSSDTSSESTNETSAESETEAEEKHLALKKGKHEFGKDTAEIINAFKENSASDIDVKSKYILEIVEQYLFKVSATETGQLEKNLDKLISLSYIDNPDGTPAQDYKYDINDPYATKATLASDFDSEDTEFYKSMLEAIQYFEYVELNYPGAYSDDEGLFRPDIKAALSQFGKYRENSTKKDASSNDTEETTGIEG